MLFNLTLILSKTVMRVWEQITLESRSFALQLMGLEVSDWEHISDTRLQCNLLFTVQYS